MFTFVQVLPLGWLSHLWYPGGQIVCSSPSNRGKEGEKQLNIWVPTNYMPDTYVFCTMQSSQLFNVTILISKAHVVA